MVGTSTPEVEVVAKSVVMELAVVGTAAVEVEVEVEMASLVLHRVCQSWEWEPQKMLER